MDYVTAVEAAVKQFYSVGNNEAHSWLLQMQASAEAWQFIWQLLEPSKVDQTTSVMISRSLFRYRTSKSFSYCIYLLQNFLQNVPISWQLYYCCLDIPENFVIAIR